MTYNIVHRTFYRYAAPVTVSHHVARLEPRETARQSRESCGLVISPPPAVRRARSDYFGNRLCFFSIQEVHSQLEIEARSLVTVRPQSRTVPSESPAWERVADLFRDSVSPEITEPYQFVFDSPLVRASPELGDYALRSFCKGVPVLAGARELTRTIYEDFEYDAKATTVATPLEKVMSERRGVCQDFAHLAIACLRSLGLPARYVSGYLRTRPPPGKERLIGADASHAWFSIFCPGAGWTDFDPTNNLQPAEEHLTVAHGRDFGDVSPVAGILTGGGEHSVTVAVDVTEA